MRRQIKLIYILKQKRKRPQEGSPFTYDYDVYTLSFLGDKGHLKSTSDDCIQISKEWLSSRVAYACPCIMHWVVSSRNYVMTQVHFMEAPWGFCSILARTPEYCSSRKLFYVFAFQVTKSHQKGDEQHLDHGAEGTRRKDYGCSYQ